MNAMDLMTGLNNVRDKFVVSAGEFRQGQREVRALPKRKLWLIAAVIALALLLVGGGLRSQNAEPESGGVQLLHSHGV